MLFDLIGRVVAAAVVLWVGYGTIALLFIAKAFIPPDCPWPVRLQAALLYIGLAPWMLLRHRVVLRGFIMRQVDGQTGEPVDDCPCPSCVASRTGRHE